MARPKQRRRLVIDASVMLAAGGLEAKAGQSKVCRDLLLAVRRICHRAVLTEEIQQEWDRHQSRFASEWRVSMVKLGKVDPLATQADVDLRQAIREAAPEEKVAEKMLKDVRLIEAAQLADGIVISLDDNARDHFARIAARVSELSKVIWVNPAKEPDGCLSWLERGAPKEKSRQLSHRKPS